MADEELKKKKKIRGGHKGYVTTTLEKVEALLDDFEISAANQVKTYRIALTEKLDILGCLRRRNSDLNYGRTNRRQNQRNWNLQRIYSSDDSAN